MAVEITILVNEYNSFVGLAYRQDESSPWERATVTFVDNMPEEVQHPHRRSEPARKDKSR